MKLTRSSILNDSSSYDKVLSKLEKITERVNEGTVDVAPMEQRDAVEVRENLISSRVSSPRSTHLSSPRSTNLSSSRVSSPRSSNFSFSTSSTAAAASAPPPKKKIPRVKQPTPFEVELVLSTSNLHDTAPPPSILSPSRRAANDIIWRAYATTKSFGAIISGVCRTQAVVRGWLMRRRVGEEKKRVIGFVNCIKAVWRGYCQRREFRRTLDGIVLGQCLIRRYLAHRKAESIRQEIEYKRDTAASTIIQARYRSYQATKQYTLILHKVLILQCCVRQQMAFQKLVQLKKERHILEVAMSTRITTLWRKYNCQTMFMRTVQCIIVCQSIVRRYASIQELNELKFQRDTVAAIKLQSMVRTYLSRKHFMKVKSSTIFLQCLYRQWIAFNELEDLKEERRLLEERSVTLIAAVWRSYGIRTGYMIVLKAARRHEERYNAASLLQAECRRYITRRNYITLTSKTIQIQTIVRMVLATTGLKSKKDKIKKAANYHKDDYFAYSKKRKGAAIRIQAMYRMVPLRRGYLQQKSEWERLRASSKIQAVYRARYSSRMSRAISKTELHGSKPIFNYGSLDCDNVEVELGKNPSTQHIIDNDFFVSAKKRRSAAINIQASFRGHLARESAKKTAYLAKNAFGLSKQRRVAAGKIQMAYRAHLFRTTCKFTPLPSFDEQSCTKIVSYVDPAEKSSDFQLVVARTDIFGLIMSMITG